MHIISRCMPILPRAFAHALPPLDNTPHSTIRSRGMSCAAIDIRSDQIIAFRINWSSFEIISSGPEPLTNTAGGK